MNRKKVVVKKSAVDSLKSFHLWIYRNQIKKTPKHLEEGEIVDIYSPDGKFLGVGYINLKSVISIRMLSFEDVKIDKNFFLKKISTAVEKRKNILCSTDAYRIIHSEADGLPGLIADFYNGYISVQINTAGMEKLRSFIVKALIDVISTKGIFEKSDEKSRKKEGLDTKHDVIYGEVPDRILIHENGVRFSVDIKSSQKTGFYLDQRKNRKTVSEYVREGFKVLDLFSNTGGFGIYAAKKGAEFVKFVDISDFALKQVEENCNLNSVKNYQTVKENAFDFLKREKEKNSTYDLIILDPPSFAKSKKEKEGALRGFKYLLVSALKLVSNRGFVAVFSCSHHVGMEDLKKLTFEASVDTKTPVEIVEHLYQDLDHPYVINVPNSLYLKGFLFRKTLSYF